MQEFELIQTLSERLRIRRSDTRLGIGDDAAVLTPPPNYELVVTSDTLVAGRHFPEDAKATDIGFKSLAVNLSDVAAMGAEPAWVTMALTLPDLDADWCDAFLDGALEGIGDANVDIVGGDTTRGPLSITVTAFGLLPTGSAITRSGAEPGDLVCVTGTLGDAALGLRLWQERQASDQDNHQDNHAEWLYRRLHRPQWRQGCAMQGYAHAAIDLSDGLVADLGHILAASDCGARINVDALPASDAFMALCPIGDRLRLQLAGGDDYELCIVLPHSAHTSLSSALGCALTPVGTIEKESGLRLVDHNGAALDVGEYPGWDHFRPR